MRIYGICFFMAFFCMYGPLNGASGLDGPLAELSGLYVPPVIEYEDIILPFIIWHRNKPTEGEKYQYFDKKNDGHFSLSFEKGALISGLHLRKMLTQHIESLYGGKKVESIYFGVPQFLFDKVSQSVSSTKVRRIPFSHVFCPTETVEAIIEYYESFGPIHVILSAD